MKQGVAPNPWNFHDCISGFLDALGVVNNEGSLIPLCTFHPQPFKQSLALSYEDYTVRFVLSRYNQNVVNFDLSNTSRKTAAVQTESTVHSQ